MAILQENPNRAKAVKLVQSQPGTKPGGTVPSTQYGLISVSAQGTVTLLDDAAEALTGRRRQEALGRDLASVLVLVDAESRSPVEDLAEKALREGRLTATTRPAILITKSGAEKLVSTCAVPVLDEKGENRGVALIVQDLSRGGKDSQDDAEPPQDEPVEALGHLAAGMAPEIHRLTRVITGGTQEIITRLDRSIANSPRIKEIQQASAHLDSLVDQMLACGRESLTLKPELVDLNSAVSDLYEPIRERVGASTEVITLVGPATAQVNADPGRIRQVISDLALNVAGTLPRAGKLVIEIAKTEKGEDSDPPEVPPGSYVLLAVGGNTQREGSVDEASASPTLLTGDPRKRDSERRLALAYHIVKKSGGYLLGSSRPGRPDSFRVFLPRVEPAAEDSATKETAHTVLLVEDETGVRNLLRDFLKSNGYKVLDTADGAEALRVSAGYDGPIHMMVTDLIMPEMAGHEVAERLSLERPNMQVIYMSGCLDSDILQEKNLKHAVPYIQKPFSLNTLGDTIREVLAAQEGGPSPRK